MRPCTCSPTTVMRYRGKISGPILDRIDLHIEVPSVKYEQLRSQAQSEKSSAVRERVSTARQIQLQRLPGEGIYSNSQMKPKHLKKFCQLDEAGQSILDRRCVHLGLSARAYHRVLKVSRTLADLEKRQNIGTNTCWKPFSTGRWIEGFFEKRWRAVNPVARRGRFQLEVLTSGRKVLF